MKTGDSLPELQLAGISRTTLALYAGAAGDHNPMHIDLDFARRAGSPDVFAHGMLIMAYLGRLLTERFSAQALYSWNARFVSITSVGAQLTCEAVVAETGESEGYRTARLDLAVKDVEGQLKLEGAALVRAKPSGPAA